MFVGMGQIVAGGGSSTSQRGERSRVQPQRVTNVVEPDGVGQLRIEQRDNVAPRTERASLLVNFGRPGQSSDKKDRDVVADLAQDAILMRRWCRGFCFFHPALWRRIKRVPTLFFIPLWDACGFL